MYRLGRVDPAPAMPFASGERRLRRPASGASSPKLLQASEEVQNRLLIRGAERLEALSHSIGFRHAGDAKGIECISRGTEGALAVVSQKSQSAASPACRGGPRPISWPDARHRIAFRLPCV